MNPNLSGSCHLLSSLRHDHRRITLPRINFAFYVNYKPQKSQPHHGEDPYRWMSQLNEKVARRHMDMYMEQEQKYSEAVMSDTERLQSKHQSEMGSPLSNDLSTPPLRWGPWEAVSSACRRLAWANENFISNKSPSAGFDFTSGKRIKQKLLDYNEEAERFGDLNFSSLCSNPQADWVSNIACGKDGQALLYVVTDHCTRPYRCCRSFVSQELPVWECGAQTHCIVEHHQGYLYLFTNAAKKGQLVDHHYLLRSPVNCSLNERKWENIFSDDLEVVIEDVDFSDKHLVLIVRDGRNFRLCSISLPLPSVKEEIKLKELSPQFFPLAMNVSQIMPGTNYVYYSSTMRFTISSPSVGGGERWHHDGRCTKMINSIYDYISCVKFLIEKEIVQENKLAGWGYSAGGLFVASAINSCPSLLRAAVLEVPFLDPTDTLLNPILPLTPADYEEFGYPGNIDDSQAVRKYSSYDNIQEDILYPSILVTSSFNTRFGVWEAAKYVAWLREYSVYDPKHPVLLNLTADIVEENRHLHCKELALGTAFLIKMMES
ncbi:unnamed protein product [Withania somnifera]